MIERLWGGAETLIVISTDLSHYHAYDAARAIDGATLARIAARAIDLNHQEACGATPLNGFLALARERDLPVKLLAACNSGDTAGGKDRVVGYSAFAAHEGGEVPLQDAGTTLLSIARAAIESALHGSDAPKATACLAGAGRRHLRHADEGRAPAGLHRQPVGRAAAGRRRRGERARRGVPRSALPGADARRMAALPRRSVAALDAEADALRRRGRSARRRSSPGEDGLILEADGKRGTFLPQVWESLPDKRGFPAENC